MTQTEAVTTITRLILIGMARFEQLVVSNRRDQWGIPRTTGEAIVNIDDISIIEDATVDTTFQAFFSHSCPRGVFAGVQVTMTTGAQHTLTLGQFDDVNEANQEVDRFTRWLTHRPLLA